MHLKNKLILDRAVFDMIKHKKECVVQICFPFFGLGWSSLALLA